jgi:hypothetical protein
MMSSGIGLVSSSSVPKVNAGTAERIRDKFAASRKRGMWLGVVVPLGYPSEILPSDVASCDITKGEMESGYAAI